MAKLSTYSLIKSFCGMLMPFFLALPVFAVTNLKEENELIHAEVMFGQGNFEQALLILGPEDRSTKALLIRAESLFRLQRYGDARAIYKELLAHASAEEQEKILVRIFDTELLSGHIEAALKSYQEFEERKKNTSPMMKYGLGKALYDAGRDRDALPLLSAIPVTDEFAMRARFLVAAMALVTNNPKEAVKQFAQIEAMKPVSVEDYGVRQLAILAVARLYYDQKRYDLAKNAYKRVSLNSAFGKAATEEMIRMFIGRADEASLGRGEFKKASLNFRRMEEKKALSEAGNAFARYRKVHEVTVKDPQLLTLMATLLVKTRRYDDAKIAFSELFHHYEPIAQELRTKEHEKKLWPYFSLNFARDPGSVDKEPLISGIPQAYVKQLPGLASLTKLKHRIEDQGQKLAELENKARFMGKNSVALEEAKKNHQAIVSAYEKIVLKQQKKLLKGSEEVIDKLLSEALFRRAELSLFYKRDLKKQENAVREFQRTTIEQFEQELKNIDKGGSP